MAIVGFVSPVAVAAFGPLVGQALDNTSRQAGLTITAGLQATFIAGAGGTSSIEFCDTYLVICCAPFTALLEIMAGKGSRRDQHVLSVW